MTTHARPSRMLIQAGFCPALILVFALVPNRPTSAQEPPDVSPKQETPRDDQELYEELETARTRVELLEMELTLAKQQFHNTLQIDFSSRYFAFPGMGGMGGGGFGGGSPPPNADDPAKRKEEEERQELNRRKALAGYRDNVEQLRALCLETSKKLGRERHLLAELERQVPRNRRAAAVPADRGRRLDDVVRSLDALLDAMKETKEKDRDAKP